MFGAVLKPILGMIFAGMLASYASAEMIYNRGNSSEPDSLDPNKTAATYEAHLLRDLFEGLLMQDAKARLIPGAAESWTVSDDGIIYTFKLRANALWSNGDPVTADDFVYSFQRLEDPTTAAAYASMLYVVKNAQAVNAGTMNPETIGVRAVDSKTLEITLNSPTPYFLELLTHQSTYPVHRPSIEKFGIAWTKPGNLVSNGPFVLAEWVRNDHITLIKNPKFHDAGSVKLGIVNYYPTEDRSTAVKRFQAGELDSNDQLPVEQLADLKATFGDQVHIFPYLGTEYFYVNLEKTPWNDAKLRRAISMAIDREFLAEKVSHGSMFPAYSIVPPGIEGYEPYRADFADMPMLDREEEVVKIFAELGFGPDRPLKLEIRYDTSENNRNTAVVIQEQLRRFGVSVSLLNLDAKTHFSYLESRGDFDFARTGWAADYKDPESFLGTLRKASGNNLGHYDSAKFESLMDEAAAAGSTADKRMQLLREAEKLVIDDLGVVPILFLGVQSLVSSRLNGWEENALDVHPSRFISISH